MRLMLKFMNRNQHEQLSHTPPLQVRHCIELAVFCKFNSVARGVGLGTVYTCNFILLPGLCNVMAIAACACPLLCTVGICTVKV